MEKRFQYQPTLNLTKISLFENFILLQYISSSGIDIFRPVESMGIHAIPSIFAILSVGFLLIEYNKGLVFNVYYLCKIGVVFTEV